jgi:hypothetical protein
MAIIFGLIASVFPAEAIFFARLSVNSYIAAENSSPRIFCLFWRNDECSSPHGIQFLHEL